MNIPSGSQSLAGVLLALMISGAGCSAASDSYRESHTIKNLTVVFLDEQSLHQQWSRVTGKSPIQVSAFGTPNAPGVMQTVKTVRGFYDFHSNTIYCGKMDFEVCGHELHHAVLGRFHNDEQ
jgi:hypothetical protein